MSEDEIRALNPSFNFKEAYKRNYCTLINIGIAEVEINYAHMIDGQRVEIKHQGSLFIVAYIEWFNTNWFHLEKCEIKEYWTTKEKAEQTIEDLVSLHGLVLLSEEEAIDTANVYISCSTEPRVGPGC